MVLCQYFLNNGCRFGSKCVNEHFDVRQLIKTEVEAALKGTQWPLSCFGPFKEKPCLPNFINDQSYEECRYMCYEAKKQNNFPAYSQQFSLEVMGAQNRMKSLLTMGRDVIETVVALYNSQDPNADQQTQKTNPFSMAGGGAVGGFGAAPNTNANSLFGSNASSGNPFASSGFGSVVQNTASIFGGSQTATATPAGLYAQQAGFGASAGFGAPNTSIFGGGQQQPQSNAFSLAQIGAAPQNNQAANGFGMTASTNAFGAPASGLFAAQNTTTPQTGLFAQQSSQMQPAGGLFGQPAAQPQQQQQQQVLGFGGQPVQQPTGMFGQTNPGQGVFGGSMTGMVQQSNAFGASMQMSEPQMQQQPPMGFGAAQPANVFGGMQQPQQQQHNTMPIANSFGAPTNVFQQNPSQPFGMQNNVSGLTGANDCFMDSAYSKMEDLPPEALEAFQAPEFIIGKLPTMPPPRELC